MAFMPQGTRNIERMAILRMGEYVAFVVEQEARSMAGGVKDTRQKLRSLLDFALPCWPSATLPKERGPTETVPGRKAETDRVPEGISEDFRQPVLSIWSVRSIWSI
jgi:hypothetical protein